MVKLEFLSVSKIPDTQTLSQLIAERFQLNVTQVQQNILNRENLGSTMIAPDISMPHVEMPNIIKQGLFLITNEQSFILALVIDSNQPDEQLIATLKGLLVEQSLEKLRKVSSQQDFEKLIGEVKNYAIG